MINQNEKIKITQEQNETPIKNNSLSKNFVIIKKIAKHGNQSIIVIPRILEYHLRPGTVVKLNIDVIENFKEKTGGKK